MVFHLLVHCEFFTIHLQLTHNLQHKTLNYHKIEFLQSFPVGRHTLPVNITILAHIKCK